MSTRQKVCKCVNIGAILSVSRVMGLYVGATSSGLSQGAVRTIISSDTKIIDFMNAYESVLLELGFQIRASRQVGNTIKHKAIWGSMIKAAAVGMLPFGKLTKTGARFCIEAQVWQREKDVQAKLMVVPYMELFNRPEVFMISQGWFERVTDEKYSHQLLDEVVGKLNIRGFKEILPEMKGDYKYCPRCGYQSKGKTYCPECRARLILPGGAQG